MSAIKSGDLVMVVKPGRCDCDTQTTRGLGLPFTVKHVLYTTAFCEFCLRSETTWMASSVDDDYWTELVRLQKIDPPSTDESTETRKEVTA